MRTQNPELWKGRSPFAPKCTGLLFISTQVSSLVFSNITPSISPMKADLATVKVPPWSPLKFPFCHGHQKKAAGKYYRLFRLKCLTTYLANRYPLTYLVLGYRSNTEIMFPSPSTSHSHPSKKHPPCHLT